MGTRHITNFLVRRPDVRITSQVASLSAQKYLAQNQRKLEVAMQQLASGNRFANSSVDPAGQAISESLKSQVRGFESASMNAQNATSLVQQAEGALNEQNNILIRLRELSVQSASDTFSEVERGFLNNEFQQLTQEVDRIAKTTRFGSQNLLDGSERSYEFHVGIGSQSDNVIKYQQDSNTTASELGLSGLSIDDQSGARDALDSLDTALEQIGSARAKLGAVQSRMEYVINNNESQKENLVAAASKIADTDVAKTISEVRRGQIMQQYQIAMLAAANENDSIALKLVA